MVGRALRARPEKLLFRRIASGYYSLNFCREKQLKIVNCEEVSRFDSLDYIESLEKQRSNNRHRTAAFAIFIDVGFEKM